jgi:hypothetical protein
MKKIFSFITAMLAVMAVCHAQANKTLSNLTSPTAVNVNLLPGGITGTKNLGSDTKRWNNGYFNGTIYCHGHSNNTYGVYSTGVFGSAKALQQQMRHHSLQTKDYIAYAFHPRML